MADLKGQNTTFQSAVRAAAPVPRRLRPHFLERTSGNGDKSQVELDKDQLVIGRGAEVEIPVADKRVSRKHALIRRQNQEYSIFDLDSLNGVYLNGQKVHSAVLRDEDVIRLGDESFIYHEG